MSVTNRELHGVDEPLEEEIALKTGPFEAIFEPARAYLRRVRIHGVECVRNVYVHARGPNWETVVPAVTMGNRKIGSDHFELTWKGVHRHGGIDFEWSGTLIGSPSGITYRCDGIAVHNFETNRTGLCALIPREYSGASVDVEHPAGSHSAVELPIGISPTPPIRNIRSIAFGSAKLTFEGSQFEAEDQRNWSDASFKCYGLPSGSPPVNRLRQGEKVVQSVRIEESKLHDDISLPPVRVVGDVLIGAAISNDHDDLSGLPVDFLRVEMPDDVGSDAAGHLLDHARSAQVPLQVVVERGAFPPGIAFEDTLIVTGDPRSPAPNRLLPVWLGAGSFYNFNSGRHEAVGFNGIEVDVTPQIHTFDERSILENAATLADVLRSFDDIVPGAPVGLNVRLKSDGPDPRLHSLFGALWILCSYAGASDYGAAHLTLGSAVDMRHPAIIALLQELSGKNRYRSVPVQSKSEIVVLECRTGVIVGNLLRHLRPLLVTGDAKSVRRLTPSGWTKSGFPAVLDPYEIVALTFDTGKLLID